jgi:hypothetical protein
LTWNSKHSLCIAALLAAACSSVEPRTQVMLIVDADDGMRPMIGSLQAQIEGSLEGSTVADATTHSASFEPHNPAGPSWPFRFPLTPRGGAHGRRYKITLSALDAKKETIAVLRSEGGFIKGKTLALSMRFEASCLGKVSLECPASETCASGKCVDARVDANALPPLSEIDRPVPRATRSVPRAAAARPARVLQLAAAAQAACPTWPAWARSRRG